MSTGGLLRVTVPPQVGSLAPWARNGVFTAAEIYGAEVISRGDPLDDPLVQLGAGFALWAPLHGHACADIADLRTVVRHDLARSRAEAPTPEPGASTGTNGTDRNGTDRNGTDTDDSPRTIDSVMDALPWPALDRWLAALRDTPVCRVTDAVETAPPLDHHALVLCGTRLYTQRQWIDECSVAAQLRRRASIASATPTRGGGLTDSSRRLLAELLPPTVHGEPNLQHRAAAMVADAHLTVIVGGPGTGKTHTVARLLAVLLADAAETGRTLRVALAAPTGKAASRMTEAVTAAAAGLPPEVAAPLQRLTASTIHRLLGSRGARTRFRHDAHDMLPYDLVVIDEASMIALPLMARLLEALRPDARLVLVGDPDQLQSIEVGTVLADIVRAAQHEAGGASGDSDPLQQEASAPQSDGAPAAIGTGASLRGVRSPMSGAVARLARSHRQRADSPIAPLADAIRRGEPDPVIEMLRAGHIDQQTGEATLQFVEHLDPYRSADGAGIRDIIVPPLTAAHEAARAGDAAEALRRFGSVRVLCAHRRGPFGVADWNWKIESWLFAGSANARPPRFYPGRPLLATRNDLRLHIANGDTGIVVSDPAGIRAAFGSASGTAPTISRLAPAQLEGIETAYAMTIHKSQGSEYGTVVVIMPPSTSPLIGRELLYTAVTRTTDRLVIVGSTAAVAVAVSTAARRVTGLSEALRR